MSVKQPMKPTQLSAQTGLDRNACSAVLAELVLYNLVVCLNPKATRHRLYWLSASGENCQQILRERYGLPPVKHDFPELTPEEWAVYGDVCSRHRSIVIRTLASPPPLFVLPLLQPAEIKRRARRDNPEIRMSANNVRDVIPFLYKSSVVERVLVRKKVHPRYRLSAFGQKILQLFKAARRIDENLRELRISVSSPSELLGVGEP